MLRTRSCLIFSLFFTAALAFEHFRDNPAQAADPSQNFVIYSVYEPLAMDPQDKVFKDYYVNMGFVHGLHKGSRLRVSRKSPTYDLLNKKLHEDIRVPIAILRVVHVENTTAVARLEQMVPADNTPALLPRAVMIGDEIDIDQ